MGWIQRMFNATHQSRAVSGIEPENKPATIQDSNPASTGYKLPVDPGFTRKGADETTKSRNLVDTVIARHMDATQRNRIQWNSSDEAALRALASLDLQPASQARPKSAANPALRWYAPGEPVTIQGCLLADGMVYVGKRLPWFPQGISYSNPISYLVDPDLPVLFQKESSHAFYASYERMTPLERGAYLGWMAGGRVGQDASLGEISAFFYSLERRILVDNPPPREAEALILEITRLRKIYGNRGNIGQYMTSLLEELHCRKMLSDRKQMSLWMPDPLQDNRAMQGLLLAAVGSRISSGRAIEFDLALSAFLTIHPYRNVIPVRTALERTRAAFVEVVRQKFHERFPKGIKFKDQPASTLVLDYHSGNGSFIVPPIPIARMPDARELNWNRLTIVCNEAMVSLAAYARAVKPDWSGALLPETLALMPAELYKSSFGPLRSIDEWLSTQPDMFSISLGDLWAKVGGRGVPKLRGMRAVATILENMQWGMEPDPVLSRVPMNVVFSLELYKATGVEDIRTPPGTDYNLAVLLLGALSVMQEDLPGSPGLVIALQDILKLDKSVSLRLNARLKAVQSSPPSTTALKRMAATILVEDREQALKLLLDLAKSRNLVGAHQIAVLETVAEALGAKREAIYKTLLSTQDIVGKQSRILDFQPGSLTDKSLCHVESGIILDTDALQRIRKETDQVGDLLANVFSQQENTPESIPEPCQEPEFLVGRHVLESGHQASNKDGNDIISGLDIEHTRLLRLLGAREKWVPGDYEELARSLELLPDGAIETLNDWSYTMFGEPLIEDDGFLLVNTAPLRAMGVL